MRGELRLLRRVHPPQVLRLRARLASAQRLVPVPPSSAHLAQAMAVVAMPLVTRPPSVVQVLSAAHPPRVEEATWAAARPLVAEVLWEAHPRQGAAVPSVAQLWAVRSLGWRGCLSLP